MSDSEREEAAIAAVQRAFAASKGQGGADKPGAEKITSAATATTATASADRQLDQGKHTDAARDHREKPGSRETAPKSRKPAEPEDDHVQPSERWDDLLQKRRLDAAASAAASGENKDNTAEARWQRGVTFATAISGSPDTKAAEPLEGRSTPAQQGGTDTSFKSKLKAAKEKAYNRDPVTGKRRPFNGQKGGQKAVKIKKELEEQHWLEMIDKKHRYGSNLKYYFEEWKLSDDAKGNFLHWLDHGAGSEVSLPKCPRDKLERERILYLSADQRRLYLVSIDRETGRFRWQHPCQQAIDACGGEQHPFVETTARKWTDLGDGRGVVPAGAAPALTEDRTDLEGYASSISSSSSNASATAFSDSASSTSDSSVNIPSYARPGALRRTSSISIGRDHADEERRAPSQGLEGHLGNRNETKGSSRIPLPSALQLRRQEHAQRKASKKKEKADVWIYVSDAQYRLYVGIKQKGYFQHSSFLAGGPITSAGTMVIHEGRLLACNPMSGHYRTKSEYFKRFVDEMHKQGADLDELKIGRMEVKLWLTERANAVHSLKGKVRRLTKRVEKIGGD